MFKEIKQENISITWECGWICWIVVDQKVILSGRDTKDSGTSENIKTGIVKWAAGRHLG